MKHFSLFSRKCNTFILCLKIKNVKIQERYGVSSYEYDANNNIFLCYGSCFFDDNVKFVCIVSYLIGGWEECNKSGKFYEKVNRECCV